MGKVKQLWQEQTEEVLAEFEKGLLDRDAAMKRLWELGWNANKASDLLSEATR